MSAIRNRGSVQNQRLQSIKGQLERETASLLAERRALQSNYEQRSETRAPIKQFFTESAALTPIVHRQEHEGGHKTQQVINRLQEVIKLCKEEGTLSNEQMREVIKVQNEVLNYLKKNNAEPQTHPTKPQSYTPQIDKSKAQPNHTWGKPTFQQEKGTLSQDTLQIIAHIERKALGQIIHLQKERDSLKLQRDHLLQELSKWQSHGTKANSGQFQRFREENRLLKQENNALNVRLSTIGLGSSLGPRRPQAGSDFVKESLASGQYDSQIAVYQNELKRASVVINQLKGRLSHVMGIDDLHQQGERIRRETAELLQYKSRGQHGQDVAVVRELQQRLQEQERGKAMFLEELKAFKQRYLEIEEENKQLRRRQGAPSPSRESASKGIIKKRSGFGEYENTLSQLRQVLR